MGAMLALRAVLVLGAHNFRWILLRLFPSEEISAAMYSDQRQMCVTPLAERLISPRNYQVLTRLQGLNPSYFTPDHQYEFVLIKILRVTNLSYILIME